jgi:pyruvate dehydrogenase E2 component (dihydrolipoamide acetyltransferase)
MTRSWSEIPHFHVSSQLDVTTALQDLAEFNRTRSVAERVLPAALLLRAVAAAARRVPAVNGWWSTDHVESAAEVDLGVVVSLRGGGLLVPTIRQADRLDRSAMMVRLAEITNRARLGRLRGSDLEPASITVSSLGDRAGEALAGIIHPPQIALVGLGSVREAPWAERGVLSARSVVTVTVAGDHRAIDGAVAASFLSAMASALAAPYEPQGSS